MHLTPEDAMRRSTALVERLRARALSHPLLFRFADLTRDELRTFATQFYCFVELFPRYIGALIWTVPDERIRLVLADNLMDECGGSGRAANLDLGGTHPELFRCFTRALGVTDEALRETKPLPTTQHFLDEYRRLVLSGDSLEAAGAFALGNECLATKWVPVIDGLRRRGEFDERALSFFSTHLPSDTVHGSLLVTALLPHVISDQAWESVERGATAAVEARLVFWQGIEDSFGRKA